MEILIPGLILVALMVYVSTKIKKNAAQAYERETIETPEFSIVKPEGFICPVDFDEQLAFAAYSKEYGRDQSDSVRQVSAEVRKFADGNFDEICERAKIDSIRIVSEDTGVLNGSKWCVIEAERIEIGVTLDVIYKILATEGGVYELRISILPEYKNDYSTRTDELLDSFVLK